MLVRNNLWNLSGSSRIDETGGGGGCNAQSDDGTWHFYLEHYHVRWMCGDQPAQSSSSGTCGVRPPPEPSRNRGKPPVCTLNPCDPLTGNKYEELVDYRGAGAFPLQFVRYYNSRGGTIDDARIGANWSHTYSRSVELNSRWRRAHVQRPDGRRIDFRYLNGAWTAASSESERLLELRDALGRTTGWQYLSSADEIETYGADGRLVSITNRAGLAHTVQRDPVGRIDRITDAFGRSLAFGYNASGRIETITGGDGGMFRYDYDVVGTGMHGAFRLVSVTRPDSGRITYHYENADFPSALTGVTDERGEAKQDPIIVPFRQKARPDPVLGELRKRRLSFRSHRSDG